MHLSHTTAVARSHFAMVVEVLLLLLLLLLLYCRFAVQGVPHV
jgi:hypothetical protein